MNIKSLVIAVGFTFAAATTARAEPVFWDDLLKAYVQAGESITKGTDRTEVLERLNEAIANNPSSSYQEISRKLAGDLAKSIELLAKRTKKGVKIEDAPEEFLIDSKLAIHLLAFPQNEQALSNYMKVNSQDPAVLLVTMGRDSIDRMIPRLTDDSPARLYGGPFTGPRSVQTILRVSDLALSLIEYLSQCKFHFNASTATAFHQLSDHEREQRIARIKEWWRENKGKSISAGIRAQLPHAEFYEKVDMAKSLIRLADKEKNAADREFGLNVLRDMLDGDLGHTAAHTARALAEFGDMSGVEYFYKQWKDSLGVKGRYYSMESEVAWYLMNFGGRREWELVNVIARRELKEEQSPGTAAIWSALVYGTKSRTSPYAIPGLGLALTQQAPFHGTPGDEKRFATQAYRAAEYLQALTGVNFGYDPKGSDPEKLAALKKAQKWWAEEGEAKYTFEYIEANMTNRGAAGKK